MFFSRRIGLQNGVMVPITGGARLTGRVGPYTVGAMSIRTDSSQAAGADATTFSAFRVRRDVFSRSAIGLIATARSASLVGDGSSQTFGIDAAMAFYQNLEVNAYYAVSRSPNATRGRSSYRAQFRYAGDRYGAELDRLMVEPGFDPEVGYVNQRDMLSHTGNLRFSPRMTSWASVRKLSWEAAFEDIRSTTGTLETLTGTGTFRIQREDGDEFNAVFEHTSDRPQKEFSVAGTTIPAGSYDFGNLRLTYMFGPRRPFIGSVAASRGGFYGGNRTEFSINGRVSLTPRLLVEPNVSVNWLDLPAGEATTLLLSARANYTMTPRMSLTAWFQASSANNSIGTNVRFRWEYRPGSDLYVVYSDVRDTADRGFPELLNRRFAVKFTRLLQL